ncbi:hypothetical protein VCUG_00539 [Vavraia culicis subsp. floridensis]|uniref:Uncharacterized protein n=1 Tax=Vavraia culicis (isolate floridensis) TaxID=948595 RepID=L2GWB1_VAVCU|nr:uncharacterized protein VCUG_00539 [Vavraia culicis subsp. floridensis]ELA47956.1 hypothetical protein VCUG_00539 [Vavraia culicis subsp. floridensis]
MCIDISIFAYHLAGYSAIALTWEENVHYMGRKTVQHVLRRCQQWAEYRTCFLGCVLGCRELCLSVNPEKKRSLGAPWRECRTSYNLCIKLSLRSRHIFLLKMLCGTVHQFTS